MPSQTQIRQDITQRIVNALETGTIPWRRPWTVTGNTGRACNAVSRKSYTGINVLLTAMHSMAYGFRSRFYATFNQWQALGGMVKKRPDNVATGEWGCPPADQGVGLAYHG